MTRVAILVLATAVLRTLSAEPSSVAVGAAATLARFHEENPKPGERSLYFVYWHPSDREPAPQYRQRLTRVMKHIEQFYADEMDRLGFGRRTIRLPLAEDGLLTVHVVKGQKPFSEYNVRSGGAILDESRPTLASAGIDPLRETVMIFCRMGEWDAARRTWKHRSPYYAGGTHRSGRAWQVDSPILDTLWLDKKKPMMRDGQYGRISMGRHNSIFIGGVAHELGHALSLPHCKGAVAENARFGTAIMGSGNRAYGEELRGEGKGAHLSLASALRLASHPMFSGSVKAMNQPARGSFEGLSFSHEEFGIEVRGSVKSALPTYAILGYVDPGGGGDYDSIPVTVLPEKNGRFVLSMADVPLPKSRLIELRLFGLQVNGSSYRRALAFRTDEAGRPDVKDLQMELSLDSVVAALNAKDLHGAENAASKLSEGSLAARIARRLLRPVKQVPLLDATQGGALSEFLPAEVKVGWGKPAYDRVPGPEMILAAGDRIFETGIYAHAPARHTYDLGGRWTRLKGFCGLARGHRGKVVFRIVLDGEEAWKSAAIEGVRLGSYDLDLVGVEKLELLVDDLGDSSSDWGFWLDPVLTR